jgi:hypothetical protein
LIASRIIDAALLISVRPIVSRAAVVRSIDAL